MADKERHAVHTFDIDTYLNHIIPRPRFYLLPQPISYWFGYRAPPKDGSKPSGPSTSVLLVWLFSFLGGFIGISIIENVFRNLPLLGGHTPPLVIASFGAAAILEYNAIESPLSQPRNLILGHFFSAIIGVGITKLFHLLPEARFEDLRWLAGAISVGLASSVMAMTKTVHPPAGATALLAATTPQMTQLGWWMLPLVLLASSLMLASAMLVNNLYKRFPIYWWTPVDLSKSGQDEIIGAKDEEKAETRSDSDSTLRGSSDAESAKDSQLPNGSADVNTVSHTREKHLSDEERRSRNVHANPELKVQIELDRIVVPDWMTLSQWEVEVLEGFQAKLRSGSYQ